MILSTHLFCLLNLSTTPQLCPPLLLAYTFDVLDLTSAQPTKYYSLFTLRDLLCTILYALCTMHYVLFTMHYALYTMHYALFIMPYALYTMHYLLYTIHYVLCIIYYALCTMHYALFTMHYALCIRIYMYLLFHVEIRRNPVILVLTRNSRRVD